MQTSLLRVIKRPIISEKSTRLSAEQGEYVFKVSSDATKGQILRAVEATFSVSVERVNVLNVKGKAKRFGRNMGKRNDWKKAYVKLKAGHSIDIGGA